MTTGGGTGGSASGSGQADQLYIDLKGRFDDFERQLQALQAQSVASSQQAGQQSGSAFGTAMSAGIKIAGGAALALAGSLAAVGAASFSLASEAAQNVNDLQAKLGLTKAEAEDVGKVAERVFGNNFGGSLTEVGEGVAAVRQQLGDLADNELQKVTEGAFAIKDTFGTEVPETVSATKTLMAEFGLTSQEALDFLAKGFQDGLDRSGDFLDTINEYSTQFKSGGADADEFFSIIKSGSQGGALGTDKAADSFKEFRLRITGGGETISKALRDIGLDADGIQERIANGSLKVVDAYGLVSKALAKTKDNTVQAGAGTALLGTQFEDLGVKGTFAINSTNTKLKDMGGATDSLNVKYNNLGSFFEGAMRQLQVALLPVGKELLKLANEATPYLTKAFAVIGDKLPGYIKLGIDSVKSFATTAINTYNTVRPVIDTTITTVKTLGVWLEKNKEILIPLAAAVAAGAAAFGVYRLAVAAVTLGTALWTAAQTAATVASVALRAALTFLTGPVGLVIAAIALLVGAGVALYRNWDEVKAFAEKTWGRIVGIVSDAINGAKAYLENIDLKELGLNIVRGLANGIKAGVGAIGDAARNLGSSLVDGIKGTLGIQSPSRVMHQLGVFTGEGFVNGLNSKHPDVVKAAQETGKAFTSALKDLQLEKLAGSISQTEYIKTLTDVAGQLRAQIKTVKEGTPAYSEWLEALTKVNAELAITKGKSMSAQAAAKEHADQLAKSRTELENSIGWDKYIAGLKSATTAQLQHAQALARGEGDSKKYAAISSEISSRQDVQTAATLKARDAAREHGEQIKNNIKQLDDSAAFAKWEKGLRSASTAQLQHALDVAHDSGEVEKYNAVQGELGRRQDAVTESTKKASDAARDHAKQISDNIKGLDDAKAFASWEKGLRSASAAQLGHALEVAHDAGEVEKYNAIQGEQQRRQDAVTAATQKASDAAKQHTEEVRKNREAIADGLEYDRWRVAMERATDAQLASGLAAYKAAGNQQRYSDVAAEIKRRASEAADEVDRLTEAQRTQAVARYTDTQGASDNSYRLSYGVGDEGLIKSLAATTGLSVEAIRADVQEALADAKRFAPEAAVIIERVWADSLAQRKAAGEAQRDLDARILASATESGAAGIAAAKVFSDAEQAAADDALVTVDFLKGQLEELFNLGRNPADSGFISYLDGIIAQGGKAAEAARTVKKEVQALLEATQTGARQQGTAAVILTPGEAKSLLVRPAAPKPVPEIAPRPTTQIFNGDLAGQALGGLTALIDGTFSKLGADAQTAFWTKFKALGAGGAFTLLDENTLSSALNQLISAGQEGSDAVSILRGALLDLSAAQNDVADSAENVLIVNRDGSVITQDMADKTAAFNGALAQIDWASYVSGLKGYTDEQLTQQLATAAANEDIANYNAVLAEQKSRTDEAAKNLDLLAQARAKLAEAQTGGQAPFAADIAALEALRGKPGVVVAELDKLIAKYKELQTQTSQQSSKDKLLDGLNTFGNYAKQLAPMVGSLFASLSGESSEVADQWSQDFGSMTSDIVNLGTAILKGDYVSAAVQVFTSIFNWFTRNKKAAEDAAKAQKTYNEQFKFDATGYGTRQVQTYTTGVFFWETTHYKETVNEAGKRLALAIEGGITNGIDDGFTKALASGNFDDFGKSLETSVGQAVLKGLQAEYIAQYMNAVLGPKIGAIIKARSTPGTADDVAAINDLNSVLPAVAADAKDFFDNVLVPTAKAFGLYGTDKPTSTPASGTDSSVSPAYSKVTVSGSVASNVNFAVFETLSNVIAIAGPQFRDGGRDVKAGGEANLQAAGINVAVAERLDRLLSRLETSPNGRWNQT